jgi:hypothetical protein
MAIGSDVDMVNLALSHLGDVANVSAISPSDGSVQADHAGRFYAQMRDWLLERFAWKFATTPRDAWPSAPTSRWAPGRTSTPSPTTACASWRPAPGYTRDTRDVALFDTETDSDGQGMILTDAADATARYIARVTDPARFSPGFMWRRSPGSWPPPWPGRSSRVRPAGRRRCAARRWAQLAFASATGSERHPGQEDARHMPGIDDRRPRRRLHP